MKKRLKSHRRSRAREKKIFLISGICAAVVLVVFLGFYISIRSTVNKVAENRIWDNIYIEDIDVSGMTKKEAQKALQEQFAKYQSETAKVVADTTETKLTLGELGLQATNLEQLIETAVSYGKTGSLLKRYEIVTALEETPVKLEATFSVDEETAKATIEEKFSYLEQQAVDATLQRENNKFIITDEQVGRKIDIETTITELKKCFKDWKSKKSLTVNVATVVDEPKVTRTQLEQIQDVIGTFSTRYATGGPRGLNVENATTRINGRLLMPGEEMSTSDAMGSRTEANGYYGAGAYQDGEVVESLGGGVCQVATTLYNAVLNAELEVTERYAHSMIVGYAEPSADATIAEGYKDLKFKNNTDTPIYVEGIASQGKVVFNIYGKETRPANRTIVYEGEILSETPAVKTFSASNEAVGTITTTFAGYPARKAKLWKIVKEDGVEVSREEVCTSTYRTKNATVTVGTATDNAEAKKIITDAIATQDEAKITDAVARAKALIEQANQSVPTVDTTPTTTPEPDVSENTTDATETPDDTEDNTTE